MNKRVMKFLVVYGFLSGSLSAATHEQPIDDFVFGTQLEAAAPFENLKAFLQHAAVGELLPHWVEDFSQQSGGIDAHVGDGITGLWIASERGKIENVRLFLGFGANPLLILGTHPEAYDFNANIINVLMRAGCDLHQEYLMKDGTTSHSVMSFITMMSAQNLQYLRLRQDIIKNSRVGVTRQRGSAQARKVSFGDSYGPVIESCDDTDDEK